ncbi:unnamed protein product [Alternaria alternata]
MSVIVPQTSHAGGIDDELAALTLQLEELGVYSEAKKGKHPIDQPPDIDVAYSKFQIELQAYEDFLADQKLAQSIGAAVHSDSVVIEDLTSQDFQAREDRRFALELSNNDPEIEAPPLSMHDHLRGEVHDWMSTVSGNIAAASVVGFSDDETEAGPAMSYVERQADTIKKLSTEFKCCTCYDRFPRASMVTAKCGDRYCVDCMKGLFMRSTKDETLYPPRCCKQNIPLDLIARHMEPSELATFELAIVEYATRKKTYCSNHDCATFIVPDRIERGMNRAVCPKCSAETCAICNHEFHAGSACPDDPLLRQTRELAREMAAAITLHVDVALSSAISVVFVGRSVLAPPQIFIALKSAPKRSWTETSRTYFPKNGASVLTESSPSYKTGMNASILGALSASLMEGPEEASNARCVTRAIISTSCDVAGAMSTSAKIVVATASDNGVDSWEAVSVRCHFALYTEISAPSMLTSI